MSESVTLFTNKQIDELGSFFKKDSAGYIRIKNLGVIAPEGEIMIEFIEKRIINHGRSGKPTLATAQVVKKINR